MTKPIRITLRVLGAAAVCAALSLVVCLDTVDYQPYFNAPYHTATVARLRAQPTNGLVVFGPLAAGFGEAKLSPTVNAAQDDPEQGKFKALSLAGYGSRRGRPATGVHDDLYVRAVALRVTDRVGVIVAADALIIPREVTEAACGQLQAESGLRREQIYFSATHTHASLGGWGEGFVGEAFAGPFQQGARTWFARQLVAAVRAAMADLQPAAFGRGSFAAPEFVRNRLVGTKGKVDDEFSLMALKQAGGRLAVLGAYAAHATVLPSSVMEFSADYPGYWRRAVERRLGGTALFLAGGVGSHGPVAGAGSFDGAERMGEALAARTVSQLTDIVFTNAIAFGVSGLEVALPELHTRLADGWRLRPWLARRLLPVKGDTFLQVFRLQDSLWISTPCDFSGELALGIKDAFHRRGRSAVITSFNGDYIGYVISPRYYHLDGYEPRTMSFFGPTVPDYLEELIRSLAQKMAD